ncbi:MAG: hypothetical protein K9G11_02855 [Rickettsiaceae bacterium]|nr:hypothetical protein [Rickettsiaceae bacterium]
MSIANYTIVALISLAISCCSRGRFYTNTKRRNTPSGNNNTSLRSLFMAKGSV